METLYLRIGNVDIVVSAEIVSRSQEAEALGADLKNAGNIVAFACLYHLRYRRVARAVLGIIVTLRLAAIAVIGVTIALIVAGLGDIALMIIVISVVGRWKALLIITVLLTLIVASAIVAVILLTVLLLHAVIVLGVGIRIITARSIIIAALCILSIEGVYPPLSSAGVGTLDAAASVSVF